MKKIQNFGDFKLVKEEIKKDTPVEEKYVEKIITEKILNWAEVEEIEAQIRAELEKQKKKIGELFGPKTEEEAKQRVRDKFPQYGFTDDVIETGKHIPNAFELKWGSKAQKVPRYGGAGDGDGMRHDNEFGQPWDDHNAPYHQGLR